MNLRWGVTGLALMSAQAMAADICEPLREHVEFQIASSGATGFAVVVVDADAEVMGKVVGTCAQGSRKLVYVRADSGARTVVKPKPPVAAPSVASAGDDKIITECRDGTVVHGLATCKP